MDFPSCLQLVNLKTVIDNENDSSKPSYLLRIVVHDSAILFSCGMRFLYLGSLSEGCNPGESLVLCILSSDRQISHSRLLCTNISGGKRLAM